ncbi:unnamed protein product [Fraxinus pennsylvanica]|uniref:Retrotransposon gag domain-containing protein n=1 Tax=Fraxinus pennsylvanica TaxID=56036 RepID=A0AAD1Z826_9LAMI|nr:unnamed protein product [Fraxinus pennsylvanica]
MMLLREDIDVHISYIIVGESYVVVAELAGVKIQYLKRMMLLREDMLEGPVGPYNHFTSLREAFYETYYHPFYHDVKQNEFLRLVQRSMSVTEYHVKFVELSKYTIALVDDERDRCRQFEQGLRAEI